ncbi:hypothetical protein OGAPHI_003211 [Ogataea philodendri]|uniref:Trafficking protein particle complex subunit n=1 Tax=Ogataea philodendri TaxID=1378263 RepID=A0A9P8P8H2_9ASCO|nr:uncharacterized protein OGAPHI_003211 [Ogataea philodendri]KAH3666762.1 hypothetical protein OGAPHI_003211 [Ogataea philodendri]
MIYSVYITSRSGSLLYQKDFKTVNSPITRQKSNDYLVIASSLHGVHAIASKITPPDAVHNHERSKLLANSNRTGLREIATAQFKIFINQTVTGVKIILFVSRDVDETRFALMYDKIYQYYCDYVLKNPFYELEMPIRCHLFDEQLNSVVAASNV